jgi:hypothetical protein
VDGNWEVRRRRVQKILEIAGFVDLQPVGFPDGGEENGFGVSPKDLKEFIGGLIGVLSLLFGPLQKIGDGLIHVGQELIDALAFEVGGLVQKGLAVFRVFEGLVSFEGVVFQIILS